MRNDLAEKQKIVDSIEKRDRTTTNKNTLDNFYRTSPKEVETKHTQFLAMVGGDKKRQAMKDNTRQSNNSPFDGLKYYWRFSDPILSFHQSNEYPS